MIDKKIEITAPEINLFPIQGKNIELSFSGDRINSDGGLLLLRELDSQLKLLSSASNYIHDERDQRYIDHSVKELLTQRVFQIAAGYEDCNDPRIQKNFFLMFMSQFNCSCCHLLFSKNKLSIDKIIFEVV